MAVVVGRSLPPAAHLHSLNSFVSKNRSPWSFRQFNIALDRSHLGKVSLLFLIWLHFSLSLSHRAIRMESATSVLLWFLGLATTPNRLFWCMSELSNRLFSNNNARFSYVPGFVVKSIMARLNLLPCRFSCESSCKHCEPGFSLIVVPREGTRVHSSLSHRILLWLWKRVRINGIYQFDSDLNRVVKPERDLQV